VVEPTDDVLDTESWLRREAEAGDTDAMNNLGNLLRERGHPDEAEPWLRRAAGNGHVGAIYNLGVLCAETGRVDEAERWWRRAARIGDTAAMASLGEVLSDSGRDAEAVQWYRQAAAGGDEDAVAWARDRGVSIPDWAVSGGPPSLIAIDHDSHHAEHVGHTADGRQFFLTTPFVPGTGASAGEEFVAQYLFDDAGQLIEASVDSFGPRASMDEAARRDLYERRLRVLGDVTFGRIEVAPFAIERFGTTFGLLLRLPDDEEGAWWVDLEPGDYMAFCEPWDSGEYDT
jgi:TPR repeat protein